MTRAALQALKCVEISSLTATIIIVWLVMSLPVAFYFLVSHRNSVDIICQSSSFCSQLEQIAVSLNTKGATLHFHIMMGR